MLTAVRDWFGQVRVAGLELPSGWFGRPHDNLHELTWSAATSGKLLLELDEQILLILTDAHDAEVGDNRLRITNCRQVTLDRQEYANMRPHVDDLGAGDVTFHGRPALT
jgi:hypothetical protein